MEYFVNPEIYFVLLSEVGVMIIMTIMTIMVYDFKKIKSWLAEFKKLIPVLSFKEKCYVSWKTDPGAWAIDAFSLSWSNMTPYIFPPFCLISRILDKVSRDQSPACILIAPMWTAQPWFPQLLHMLIANPIKLPEDCLISQPHQPIPNLHLAAWVISGNTGKQKAFQLKLPASSPIPGVPELRNSMSLHGIVGLVVVINKQQISYSGYCQFLGPRTFRWKVIFHFERV